MKYAKFTKLIMIQNR